MPRLPSQIIADELHDLVKAVASEDRHNGSISSAVRELLKESPRIVTLAAQRGIDLGALNVEKWGGQRDKSLALHIESVKSELAVQLLRLGVKDVKFSRETPRIHEIEVLVERVTDQARVLEVVTGLGLTVLETTSVATAPGYVMRITADLSK